MSGVISIPEHPEQITHEQLKALAGEPQKEDTKQKTDTGSRLDVPAYLSYYGRDVVKEKTHGDSTLYCLSACVFDPSHAPNEASIIQGGNGALSFQCFHHSCQGKTWQEARQIISGNDKLTQFLRGNNTGSQEQRRERAKTENSPRPGDMVFTRLAELLREPTPEYRWSIEDMLVSGGLGVCVGKPKIGKSTLCRQLAYCVGRGENFLNFNVRKGSVLYLELEEKRDEVKRHYQDMGASDEDVHIYTGSAPRDVLDQVKKVIGNIRPVLIIIDPLFKYTKVKQSGEYAENIDALDQLVRLARDHEAAVVAIHHSPKGDREAIESVLGSIGIAASFDSIILVKRYENYRTIQTVQRYGTDLPETTLEFDEVTRFTSIGKSKYAQDVERLKDVILTYLENLKDSSTEDHIAKSVEGTHGLKRKALRDLLAEGKIERTGNVVSGRSVPYLWTVCIVR
jgi:hypothetical protein